MNQQAIDILDEMIGSRVQSTRIEEGKHENIRHNADMRYEINILKEAKYRIKALGDGWNKFSEKSPKEGNSIIVYCTDVYAIADVDDGCLIMDNEWEYEWTHWMPLPNSHKQ